MSNCLNQKLSESILRNFMQRCVNGTAGFDVINLRTDISKYHCVERLNDRALKWWAACYLTATVASLCNDYVSETRYGSKFEKLIVNSITTEAQAEYFWLAKFTKQAENGERFCLDGLTKFLPLPSAILVTSQLNTCKAQVMITDEHVGFWLRKKTVFSINFVLQRHCIVKAADQRRVLNLDEDST